MSTNQKPYLDNAKHHKLSFRQYFPCMQLHHIWEDDIPAFVSWFLRRSLSRDSRVSKLSAYHQLKRKRIRRWRLILYNANSKDFLGCYPCGKMNWLLFLFYFTITQIMSPAQCVEPQACVSTVFPLHGAPPYWGGTHVLVLFLWPSQVAEQWFQCCHALRAPSTLEYTPVLNISNNKSCSTSKE